MSSAAVVIVGLWAVAVGLWLAAARSVAAARGAGRGGRAGAAPLSEALRRAAPIVALRCLCLGALAWLAWTAFVGRGERVTTKPRPREEDATIVFLQDRSLSMDFLVRERPGGFAATRGDMAERTWRDIRSLAARGGTRPAALRRVLFARNAVADGEGGRLLRDATNTAAALAECLSREEVRAVVLASDGASTEGEVPGYVLDWARNRGLPVFAICTADADDPPPDLAVRSAGCLVTNPGWIDVRLACDGGLEGAEGTLALEIDGRPAGTRAVPLAASSGYRLEVPVLPEGWHEYAVRVAAPCPEVTAANNVALGVFRVAPPQKILLLVGPPRAGNPALARILRRLRPGRVAVAHLRDPRLAGARANDVRLVVLAGVAPADMPPRLRLCVEKGRAACLTLAEPGLGTHPLGRIGAVVRVAEEGAPAGRIIAGPAAALSRCWNGIASASDPKAAAGPGSSRAEGPDLRALTLGFACDAELRSGTEVLLAAEADGGPRPLLVADAADSPAHAALLTDVGWKWAMHPDPSVRAAHAALWRRLVEWMLDEERSEHPLEVELSPDPSDAERTLARVVAPWGLPGAADIPLERVRLTVEERGGRSTVAPERRDGAFVHSYRATERPAVVWFSASAERDGRRLASARKPLVVPVSSAELLDVAARPERLRALAARGERFAFFRDRAAVLELALGSRDEEPVACFRSPEERRVGREVALALACVLLAGLEWLLERRAYRRAGERA